MGVQPQLGLRAERRYRARRCDRVDTVVAGTYLETRFGAVKLQFGNFAEHLDGAVWISEFREQLLIIFQAADGMRQQTR